MAQVLMSFGKVLLGFVLIGGALWVLWEALMRWPVTRTVFLIGSNTVTGVLRGVVLNVLVLLAALAIFVLIWPSGSDNPEESRRILVDSGLAAMTVLGALIAIFTGFTLIPNEIESRTVYPVLSKPVRRWQFVLGKYVGAIAVNAITLGLLALLFFLVYILREQGRFDPRLVIAVGMMFGMLAVLSGLIIFLSTFMSWIGTIIVSMVIWFLGSYSIYLWDFAEMTADKGAPVVSTVSFKVVQKLIPNFQALDLRQHIIETSTMSWGAFDAAQTWLPLANAAAYLVVSLLLAMIVFNYREV